MNVAIRILSGLLVFLLLAACGAERGRGDSSLARVPGGALAPDVREKDAPRGVLRPGGNLYEVNVRNYTREGTFRAFEAHLPRLRAMGIDVLWLMPIHRISREKRTGSLGSPYAVADYRSVNPEFGTREDFHHLVEAIHREEMKVIIDWVPNHTGWDHPWIEEHPEYYTRDSEGRILDPINPETGKSWGWLDVADLDYASATLRSAMIGEMAYWVETEAIDGFRVDVAHGVPIDFWKECTKALTARRELFLLAESEIPDLVRDAGFSLDYGWETAHVVDQIAASFGARHLRAGAEDEAKSWPRKTARDLAQVLAVKISQYPGGGQLHFTSNHDENSWNGAESERLGPGRQAFFVLAAMLPGVPLLYSGQESDYRARLPFFERAEIEWGNFEQADFFTRLFRLRHENRALHDSGDDANFRLISKGKEDNVLAFVRSKGSSQVVVFANLSNVEVGFEIDEATWKQGGATAGVHRELFRQADELLDPHFATRLGAWEYRVYSR